MHTMAPVGLKSSLNPYAKEFVPGQPAHAQVMATVSADSHFAILDLPSEILTCVMSELASEDAWQCVVSNKQLQGAIRTARLSFSLSDRRKHTLGNPAKAQLLDQLVKALVRYMQGTVNCNLSMLPLESSHISSLASNLPQLQVLDLSGCKKLQPAVTKILMQPGILQQLQCLNLQRCFQLTYVCLSDVLLRTSGSGVASASSKVLQCIAFSHLNLAGWPFSINTTHRTSSQGNESETSPESGITGSLPESSNNSSSRDYWWRLQQVVQSLLQRLPPHLGHSWTSPLALEASSLRVVTLNNCTMVSWEGLVSIAVSCPQLEYFMIGGSTLTATTPAADAIAGPAVAAYVPPQAAAPHAAAGAAVAAPSAAEQLPAALRQLAELLQLPAELPWEALSSCCHRIEGEHAGCGCSCACCSNAGSSSSTIDKRNRLLLVRNQPSAASIAAARGHALAIAYAVMLLPRLKAIEVTFLAPGVCGWLRQAMQRLQTIRSSQDSRSGISTELSRTGSTSSTCSADSFWMGSEGQFCNDFICCGSGRDQGHCVPQVWEFSSVDAVQQATRLLQQPSSNKAPAPAEHSSAANHSGLSTALSCAVNCSTKGRSTPLHVAAETGCACHLKALLQAGAVVNARDVGGASPMFVAAEAGKASTVAVLLEAGADALIGNSAGETPLYIAALRGHLPVVQLLVEHLSAAGVNWMNGRLYGDAWTPLMAAAVANRVDVAVYLLQAATGFRGSNGNSGSGASVAERYNSPWLQWHRMCTTQASSVGAAAVQKFLAAENRYGQTALHIAARKGCRELLQLLLVYGAGRVAGQLVDAAGDTPLDIAHRHGHQLVLHELLQRC
eukprot:GHUV01002734.1.p1 GENE.GHUV01002734.1~~GHUV01002734.1.p1  ORF type:complete len:842 (+),score=303.61 GHUV01002734.1:543-3068(+)